MYKTRQLDTKRNACGKESSRSNCDGRIFCWKAKIVRCPITKSSGKELKHNRVTAWKYLLAICLRGFWKHRSLFDDCIVNFPSILLLILLEHNDLSHRFFVRVLETFSYLKQNFILNTHACIWNTYIESNYAEFWDCNH